MRPRPGDRRRFRGRLKAAGAVVFGKTNLPLYAGDVQTFNEVYGRTNNRWDVDRAPGGSSGGAAAALAAGFTGFELGSDIGGSIRNPAHFCGVFGLKTTWGVVPGRGHIPGLPGTLSPADVGVFGPLGRSATDLVLGLDVLAGPDEADAVGWRLELPPPRNGGDVAGLRAMVARHRDWLRANEARHRHRAAFAELFRHHDVLLAPVMPTAAFPHDTKGGITQRTIDVDGAIRSYMENIFWSGGIGTLLLPVAVPPDPAGLPVGVQVVAAHLEDRTAVAVAAGSSTSSAASSHPRPSLDAAT